MTMRLIKVRKGVPGRHWNNTWRVINLGGKEYRVPL